MEKFFLCLQTGVRVSGTLESMNAWQNFWSPLWLELKLLHLPIVLLGTLLGLLLLRKAQIPRMRLYLLMLVYLFLLVLVLPVRLWWPNYLPQLRLIALLTGYAVLGSLLTHVIFECLIPRLEIVLPRILQDLFFAGLMLVIGSLLVSAAGYNLSALIPTSAVLTAVLGLALQDTLGNFISGMTLQMDHSIQVGDWIHVDELEGRVSELHWRYLALETRNWETVILPNSLLMKSRVRVLGKRQNEPLQWRRWIYFQVDYHYSPSEVIAAVREMLEREADFLPQVAALPVPNCVVISFEPGYARYAIRYWLTDLNLDDPTDHELRIRLYFALQRAGIRLALPMQQVLLTDYGEQARDRAWEDELERRRALLQHLELFQSLTAEELEQLVPKLIVSPFGKGEVITRQGAEGHWLYIVKQGEVSVQMQNAAGQVREVRRLYSGDFFGEMSLLTGAPRTATVIALSDVLCYRLDKQTFQAILTQRPDLAEYLADVLLKRQAEYLRIRQELAAVALSESPQTRENLLERISHFFGL